MTENYDVDPEKVEQRLNPAASVSGSATDLYRQAQRHYQTYEELVEEAVEDEIVDGEKIDMAMGELELADKILEKAEAEVQLRDGYSSLDKMVFKREKEE